MSPSINRIVIYTKNIGKMAAFYERFFDFMPLTTEGERVIELQPRNGGTSLMLLPAARSVKEGQVCVKLVFDVEEVELFRAQAAHKGASVWCQAGHIPSLSL